MPRPREFDEQKVLEAAMLCFWRRGYEQTSMRDLAEEMGINTASVYNAFGDKRTLYRQELDHYLEHSTRDRIERLSPLPPLSALRAFFGEIVERSVTDTQQRGCMLVNAALEVAPHDPAVKSLVADEIMFIQSFFRRCVGKGQDEGTITVKRSAEELATTLLSVLLGIRVLARTCPQRQILESAADGALALLKRESQLASPSRSP